VTLDRFVRAQDRVYDRVLAELRAGEKRSHWMWFVFPQIDGLGSSPTARESELVRATTASPSEVFGFPDDLKLRSSMTLFARAAPDVAVFGEVIDRHYGGEYDERTDNLLRGRSVS
jgi:uncharacterized protein (DUF1810 family)